MFLLDRIPSAMFISPAIDLSRKNVSENEQRIFWKIRAAGSFPVKRKLASTHGPQPLKSIFPLQSEKKD